MSAGFSKYAYLASIYLIARAAKDKKINVSEASLSIDSTTPKSSGAALFLLRKLLLISFEKEDSLATIELLLYSVSQQIILTAPESISK